MTIFLTTHYMDEAEISHMVAIMDHGKIVAMGTPYQLKKQYTKDKAYITTTNGEKLEAFLKQNSLTFKNKQTHYSIEINDVATVLDLFGTQKGYITDLEVKKGTLNDVFISITGKDIREANNPEGDKKSKGGQA